MISNFYFNFSISLFVQDFTPSPTDPAIMTGRQSNGDVRRPSVSVHSKNKNWYSHLCNRWLSLAGVSAAKKYLTITLQSILLN